MTDRILAGQPSLADVQQRFVTKVYGWMTVALLTTALVAWYVVSSPQLVQTLAQSRFLFFGILIGELVLVMAISAGINRLSATAATALFFLYAALNGITISFILLIYTAESVATTFLVTAGTFGIMSFYGLATKRDLTSVGNIAFMALIGLIVASVVNIFFASSWLYALITYAGILIFVGLTAYDAQRIKQMAAALEEGSEMQQKGAIIGALRLYLDFINLFLLLLRLLGRRR